MPNTSSSSGSFLTRHPTLFSYSQPTHPSGHHLPFAGSVQQAYSGSNAFKRSPAMLHRARTGYMIHRARSGVSVNNFAPLADVASGHGGSWNSANIPRSYSSVSASRRVGDVGARGSRSMGASRFLPPRQLEHYLFAHSEMAGQRWAKASKALEEARAEVEKARAKVESMRVALKIQSIEVERLRKELRAECEKTMNLRTALAQEEEKRKAQEGIGTAVERAIESFKSSRDMEDTKIAFAQEAFIEGF
ncbi:hypothetical protein COCNU_02G004700 [Cocos nucifera]|uniref:Uncharacterized protein n=1 Tax=Cocos nucifera TaxID=13894 RepID=A0A8K0MWK0_COCNU|nr:hypothetical protein COCNU_02G004700 [Cocos nucifera]